VRGRIQKTLQRIDDSVGRLDRHLNSRLRTDRQRIERLGARLRDADLARALALRRSRLTGLDSQLRTTTGVLLGRLSERLSVGAGKLNSLSPLAVLARGYAIAFDSSGRVIKRAVDVESGDRVRVKVSDGDFSCIKE
jgi:exodeoxyribonuclease VII large subunit